jgi:hypothetical protein
LIFGNAIEFKFSSSCGNDVISVGYVVAVPVVDLRPGRFGKSVSLFRLPDGAEYDVVNGKRFLVNEPVGTATMPLFVIANWRPEQPKSE